MPELTLDASVTVSPNAVFRDLDGEAVILDLESGTYFGLNAVGTRMWHLLAEHGHLREVHAALTREFDADAAVLERDLLDLVTRLVDTGLTTAT